VGEVALDEGGNVGQVRPSESWRDGAGGRGGCDLMEYWYQTSQISNKNAFEDARVVVENAGGGGGGECGWPPSHTSLKTPSLSTSVLMAERDMLMARRR
jgi:hypothetical protein